MSASNELLMEQIRTVSVELERARAARSQDVASLEAKLSELQKKYQASQQALNESTVLKG